MNSARFLQRLSSVYARATALGFRLFQPSSAIRTFCAAVSAVKGGRGGRDMRDLLDDRGGHLESFDTMAPSPIIDQTFRSESDPRVNHERSQALHVHDSH